MPSRTVTVRSTVGLHARPAALFVKSAAATGLPVKIRKGDGPDVDARSILMVMGVGGGHLDEVTMTAEGDRAEAVLDELAVLLETDHDA